MRSWRERVVHTVLFEAIAIAIVTPTLSMLTESSLTDSGTLSLIISVGAVLSNAVWTVVFDRIVPTRRRSLATRAVQAIGLEAIIASYTIPLTMVFTGVSLGAAVLLDLGGIAFFVLFGMVYNAAFDAVMLRLGASEATS